MDKKTLLDFIAQAYRHGDHEFTQGNLTYLLVPAYRLIAPAKELVTENLKPVWGMDCQGSMRDNNYERSFFQNGVFPFLNRALMRFDNQMPYRGPSEYSEGHFTYTFRMEGDFDQFTGKEAIAHKGIFVFWQDVIGSLIR